MSISSLTRFSVPIATEVESKNQSLLMPKLQYRFRVTLENFGGASGSSSRSELTKQVIDVTRPNVTFEDITLDVYNSKIFLAGKHTWDPVTLNVRDDASGNIQILVGQQLQKQFDFYNQASARSGSDYKFLTRIEILDGNNGADQPAILETFELYGCYLQSANYNTLNYATSEPVTVTLSIRYDNALQAVGGNGNGVGDQRISRTTGELTTGAAAGNGNPAAL